MPCHLLTDPVRSLLLLREDVLVIACRSVLRGIDSSGSVLSATLTHLREGIMEDYPVLRADLHLLVHHLHVHSNINHQGPQTMQNRMQC